MYQAHNIYFAENISELNSICTNDNAAVTIASSTSLSMLIPLLKSLSCNQKNNLNFFIMNDFIDNKGSKLTIKQDCPYISDEYVTASSVSTYDRILNGIQKNQIFFRKKNSQDKKYYKSFFFEWLINQFKNTRIRIIFVNYNNLLKSNSIQQLSTVSKSESRFINNIYLKFFLPRFFYSFTNLLYIDVDTLVLSDLSKLTNFDFEKNIFYAMSQHIYYSEHVVNKRPVHSKFTDLCQNVLNIPITRYFNSGVIVYNIKSCNENKISEFWVELYNKHKDSIIFNEQDIMNIPTENIAALPLQYGARETDMKWYNLALSLSKSKVSFEGKLRDIEIVHYYGPKQYDYCPNLDNKIWWEYALSTPFARFTTLFNLIVRQDR